MTKGTTFDQGFVWETYNDLLKSAKILGADDSFLKTVSDQINKLDPILIGESGQVKEYREEKEYGDIGDPKVSVSTLQATGDAAAQALLLLPSLTLKLFGIGNRDTDRTGPCTASLE